LGRLAVTALARVGDVLDILRRRTACQNTLEAAAQSDVAVLDHMPRLPGMVAARENGEDPVLSAHFESGFLKKMRVRGQSFEKLKAVRKAVLCLFCF
jgi:hypothetical protein